MSDVPPSARLVVIAEVTPPTRLTESSARVLNLDNYGLAVGNPADVVILDAESPEQAIAEISQPLDQYAKYGVQYLKDALDGKKLKLGKTDHNSTIVKFNGNLMDLLPATLVTKANADDASLWGNAPEK